MKSYGPTEICTIREGYRCGFWKFYGSVRMRMRGDMGTLIQLLNSSFEFSSRGCFAQLRGVCFRSGVSFYFTQYSRYDLSHVDKSDNYSHLFRGYIEEEKKKSSLFDK